MITPQPDAQVDASAEPRAGALRRFARFDLLELLGRSQRTMAWRVRDPDRQGEMVLVLPRTQPPDAASLQRWESGVTRAARLDHPHLGVPVEIAVHERWPYAAYAVDGAVTLAAQTDGDALAPREAAACIAQAGQALAFVHDAGLAHGDLQPYLILVGAGGQVRLLGAEVGVSGPAAAAGALGSAAIRAQSDDVRRQREQALQDVLALGLVLHQTLLGRPAFDEPDTGRAAARLPPAGREFVRLPWTTAGPIPMPMRVIANRSTDAQEQQRYRSPRTFVNALESWLEADAASGGGVLETLLDRLTTVGMLPSLPGASGRVARLALMESERVDDIAELVLEDPALAFEMLRVVNGATIRGAQVVGNGPVLTVRRAIAMLGIEGVRRAALGLRAWPGALDAAGASHLSALIDRCKQAGRAARALRPAGYDAEVVYLVTLLQNLGRLLVAYHLPSEAQQIRRLSRDTRDAGADQPDESGLSEETAAYAVLGVDFEAVTVAVARHWGLDDDVLHLIRRLPLSAVVHQPTRDDEVLRVVGSCANEAVDALQRSPRLVAAELARVAQRYARPLTLSLSDLQKAVTSRAAPIARAVAASIPTLTEEDPAP